MIDYSTILAQGIWIISIAIVLGAAIVAGAIVWS